MSQLESLKAKLKLIIDEYKVMAAEKGKIFGKANKPIDRELYYFVEDNAAIKNEKGQWVIKRIITAKKNETKLMTDCYKNIYNINDEDLNTEGLGPMLDTDPKAVSGLNALKSEDNVFLITYGFNSNREIYGNVLRVVDARSIDVPTKQMDGVIANEKISRKLNNPFPKSACFEILRVLIK